jgi:Na+-driven multidrug efflux pump
MGVRGAAIATVMSRFAELLIVAIWTRITGKKSPFILGAFKSLYVPRKLVGSIIVKGMPLLINEALWSMGMAAINQSYSSRGIEVVAANNILQTFFNVFSVAFMAVGVAIGILLGQQLGARDEKGAMDTCRKLIAFSVLVSVIVGAAFFVCAYFIPKAYNYPDSVRLTATHLMQICAVVMPIDAFAHATYFTLRSGGKSLVTFAFDSGFMWVISVPVAFALSSFTQLNILWLFTIVQLINVIKCIMGYIFVKKGIWIRNIVSGK